MVTLGMLVSVLAAVLETVPPAPILGEIVDSVAGEGLPVRHQRGVDEVEGEVVDEIVAPPLRLPLAVVLLAPLLLAKMVEEVVRVPIRAEKDTLGDWEVVKEERGGVADMEVVEELVPSASDTVTCRDGDTVIVVE